MLKQIFGFLYGLVYKNPAPVKEQEKKPDLTDVIGYITFKLNKDETINILCHIPETKDLSNSKMTDMAEKYAQLLVCINEGLLSTEIAELIKNSISESDYDQDKLFFENVLTFWAIHHIEYLKKKKTRSDQPLIMPSSVFRG